MGTSARWAWTTAVFGSLGSRLDVGEDDEPSPRGRIYLGSFASRSFLRPRGRGRAQRHECLDTQTACTLSP